MMDKYCRHGRTLMIGMEKSIKSIKNHRRNPKIKIIDLNPGDNQEIQIIDKNPGDNQEIQIID